jgi:hypothetical protein
MTREDRRERLIAGMLAGPRGNQEDAEFLINAANEILDACDAEPDGLKGKYDQLFGMYTQAEADCTILRRRLRDLGESP